MMKRILNEESCMKRILLPISVDNSFNIIECESFSDARSL